MGDSITSLRSSQHSSQGHFGEQNSSPRYGGSPREEASIATVVKFIEHGDIVSYFFGGKRLQNKELTLCFLTYFKI
jgi:hypothetical protein